ncbi:MAG: hypothetical protein ACOYZ6_02025 [Chloroflexota bacterium]
MKRIEPSFVIGLILILVGGLFILQNMGILDNVGDVFWGGVFLAAGALFLFAFITGSWWAVIPGLTLAGLGVLILLPDPLEKYGGALFLGSISLAFWLVFVTAMRERWWAIIPAGTLTTLAIVSFLPEFVGGIETGAFFFFGLAVTFALVALLAGMRWAWYPAAALGALGLVVLLAVGDIANYIMAAVLIGAGVFLLYRYFRRA